MTTIDVQDLDAESGKDKLQGHLASEDFFNVEAHGKVGVKLTQIVDGNATVAIEFLGNTMNETFPRSEEHTSELQSRPHLVCRLLLEKKKKKTTNTCTIYKKKKIMQYNA